MLEEQAHVDVLVADAPRELAVVGDFDPTTIASKVEGFTAKWQTKQPFTRLANKAFGVPAATKSIMLGALVIYGTTDGFVGYVFLLPFAFVGITLWAFGKWAARYALPKSAPTAAPKA